MLSLDHLEPDPSAAVDGDVDRAVDRAGDLVWLPAGLRLHQANVILHEQGLALPNLGDIDVQSLAGATATGTHGTGRALTSLSGAILGLELLDARGGTHRWTAKEDPDLLDAVRVNLGALGVIARIAMNVRPSFRLRRRTSLRPTDDVLAEAMERWDTHRNFEFMPLPQTGFSLCISHDEPTDPATPPHESDDDRLLMLMKLLRDLTGPVVAPRRAILRLIARAIEDEEAVDHSHRILPSSRNVFFNEMEYHLPVETGLTALEEVLAVVERDHPEIWFPLECRMTAGDGGWLSPFQGGPRISVAVHASHEQRHEFMFRELEPIFRRHGGRPHWGKLHGLTHDDVLDLYPDAPGFISLRDELDPEGRFLNDHLRGLLVG